MNRLTEVNPGWLGEEPWAKACRIGDEHIDQAYEKLWRYENTGLEPEEIPQWISVFDDLPEVGEKVIARGIRGGLHVGAFRGVTRKDCPGRWIWKSNVWIDVVYWMPQTSLPKPQRKPEVCGGHSD